MMNSVRKKVYPSSSSYAKGNGEGKRRCNWKYVLCGLIVIAIVCVIGFVYSSENIRCPLGYWCLLNVFKFPCPAGRYGSEMDLFTSNCSGVCEGGYYCPEASTSKREIICPAGHYCPQASGEPIGCPGGSFNDVAGAIECVGICSAGYYCQGRSNSSTETICPKGYYCPAGSSEPTICPQGYYGQGEGLSTSSCSGLCEGQVGKYCPIGSVKDEPVVCPEGSYCNGSLGASSRIDCPGGVFSSGGSATASCEGLCEAGYYCPRNSSSSREIECPKGHYCSAGSSEPTPCPMGYYSDEKGLMTNSTCKACDDGFLCLEGSTSAQPALCPKGYYCNAIETGGLPRLCPPGYACIAGTFRPSLLCSRGYYCPEGTSHPEQYPCPAGVYGGTEGLTTADCSAPCPAQHYCPEGTANPFVNLCPQGYYCPQGTTSMTEYPCPGGIFSARWSLENESQCFCNRTDDPMCTLNNGCAPKYYCPPGSTSDHGVRCPFNHYCPANVSEPILCTTPGYHCMKRESDPFARPNEATLVLMNNVEEKYALWSGDYPAIAEQYYFEGYPLAEAFVLGTTKSTYTGPLYDWLMFAANRGVTTLHVRLITKGFFTSILYVCNARKEHIATVANVSRVLPRNDSANAEATFDIYWDVPRYTGHDDGAMTLCLNTTSGTVMQTFESEMFEILSPNEVVPVKQRAVITLGVLYLMVWAPLTALYLLRADKSRAQEIRELAKEKAHISVRVVFFTTMVVEVPQLLCVTLWHPGNRLVRFEWSSSFLWPEALTQAFALHFLPLAGFMIAMCFLCGLGIVHRITKNNVVNDAVGDLCWNTLYIPVLLTLLAPFDCTYFDKEFRDQVLVRDSDAIQCWNDSTHFALAIAAFIASVAWFAFAIRRAFFAREENTVIAYIPYHRVLLVSVKTALCITAVLTSSPPLLPTLFFGFSTLLFSHLARKWANENPALGRGWQINEIHIITYAFMASVSLWSAISTLVASNSYPLVLPLVACLTSALFCVFVQRKIHPKTWAIALNADFEHIVKHGDTVQKQFCVAASLNFLVGLHHDTFGGEKRLERKVITLLKQLGSLTQQVDQPKICKPATSAIVNLLHSNTRNDAPENFCIHSSHLAPTSSSSPLAPPSTPQPYVKLYGEKPKMLLECFKNIVNLNLDKTKLDTSCAHCLAELVQDLSTLRTFSCNDNPDIAHDGVKALINGVTNSVGILEFHCIQQYNALHFCQQLARMVQQRTINAHNDNFCLPILRANFGMTLDITVDGTPNARPQIDSITIAIKEPHIQDLPIDGGLQALIQATFWECYPQAKLNIYSRCPETMHEIAQAMVNAEKRLNLHNLKIQYLDIPHHATQILPNTGSTPLTVTLVQGLLQAHPAFTHLDVDCVQTPQDAIQIAPAVLNRHELETIQVQDALLPIKTLRNSPTITLTSRNIQHPHPIHVYLITPIAAQNEVLEKIEIHNDDHKTITHHALEHLLDHLVVHRLRKIVLGSWVGGAQVPIPKLATFITNSTITSLDLRNGNIQPPQAMLLANAIPDTLRSLKLDDNNIADDGIVQLSQNIKNINKLCLARNKITLNGFKHLCEHIHRTSIQKLVLDGNTISDLQPLIQNFPAQLHTLSIAACSINNTQHIAQLVSKNTLKSLCIAQNHLAENTLAILDAIANNNNKIQEILLQQCSLDNKFILHLCELINDNKLSPQLQTIDISANNFTPEIIPHICLSIPKSNISSLTMVLIKQFTSDHIAQLQHELGNLLLLMV